MSGFATVVLGILALFVPILVFLLGLLWQSTRTHGSRLATAIDRLGNSLDGLRKEYKADREKDQQEYKEDREKDLRRVGVLYDRMKAQETKCDQNLKRCPHQGTCKEA